MEVEMGYAGMTEGIGLGGGARRGAGRDEAAQGWEMGIGCRRGVGRRRRA